MSFQQIEIEPITATQQSLVKIFSDEYAFTIPPYQRPYAWEPTQAGELLTDIQVALKEALDTKSPITYFLGSIVLIKKPGSPPSEVVDGQQRLTTLSILIAVLRDLSSEPDAVINRHKYLCEQGDFDRGTKDRFRLTPRKQDAVFFQDSIQKKGQTKQLKDTDSETESQNCMLKNAIYFRKELEKKSEEERNNLVAFLLQRCYLVVISVSNVETAHRVFTVLNARGLDLTPTDILKADLLDRIDISQGQYAADTWEQLEMAIGRDRFVELFQHIRMIYQKEKPRERLEIGFPRLVKIFVESPEAFLKEVLLKYGKTYLTITNPIEATRKYGNRSAILLSYLLRLDNSDWLPIVLDYLSRLDITPLKAETFLTLAERLAYFMFVVRSDINTRIYRYSKALGQLQENMDPEGADSALLLTAKEKKDFLNVLDSPIYEMQRVRLPLLLRLDSSLTDGAASYEKGVITVEHVMPQNPLPDSPWATMYPDPEEHYQWTHCLGNLVLLTNIKNIKASNWEFDRKKREYFSADKGVTSFRLTTMVLNEEKWDEDTLSRRHYDLIKKLADEWSLDYEAWDV